MNYEGGQFSYRDGFDKKSAMPRKLVTHTFRVALDDLIANLWDSS
jgi:hypothetical protein